MSINTQHPEILSTSQSSVGTLTISSMTQNSILFAGVGGLISQNNSKLAWDDTNLRLTVGTSYFYTPNLSAVIIGQGAGTLTASGGTTVGIGHGVMASLSSGYGLTGIGDAAFAAVTTGYQSTAVGASALQAMVDGHHNSAFGVQALKSLTSGTQNTAIGIDSLEWITTQSGNTGCGYQAGMDGGGTLTNLTNCTFLGTSATASANGLTNAMAIGYAAQVGANNTVVIGNGSIASVLPGVSGAILGSSTFAWKLIAANGTVGAPGLNFAQNAGDGIFGYTGGVIGFTIAGTGQALLTTNEIRVASSVALNWGSSTYDSTGDIGISRVASHTLGITDASHAMALRVYGNGSVYASLIHNGSNAVLDASSGLLVLGGTATIVASAAILCGSDGGFDLGGGSNRFANGYFSGTLRFGTLSATSDAPITGYITITDAGGTTRKLAVIS